MKEGKKVQIEQSLEFEKSGEIFSIRITLENVGPNVTKKEIIEQLNVLYQSMIDENFICCEKAYKEFVEGGGSSGK